MAGPRAKTSATSIVAAQRRAEMLRLRVEGYTLEEIGARMGVQPESVHGVISRALRALVAEPAEELLALELARCELLMAEALAVIDSFHPALCSGSVVRAPVVDRDGEAVLDRSSGVPLVMPIEDTAPRLAAIAMALRVMERRARLLGLDKPTKIAPTDPTGVASLPQPVVFYLPANGR